MARISGWWLVSRSTGRGIVPSMDQAGLDNNDDRCSRPRTGIKRQGESAHQKSTSVGFLNGARGDAKCMIASARYFVPDAREKVSKISLQFLVPLLYGSSVRVPDVQGNLSYSILPYSISHPSYSTQLSSPLPFLAFLSFSPLLFLAFPPSQCLSVTRRSCHAMRLLL